MICRQLMGRCEKEGARKGKGEKRGRAEGKREIERVRERKQKMNLTRIVARRQDEIV